MSVYARALSDLWQVEYSTGSHSGVSDTMKNGVGGGAGLRPHELLEAAVASCMTITARMCLEEHGCPSNGVGVEVELERTEDESCFRYSLHLPTDLEQQRAVILDRLENSAVKTTLSKLLVFEPLDC
ncbi:MAG: OsmC family protein [Propionibacteriaceae bacterium]|nr:OsmC family protein [Propionibacteriaceae bacterium]